MANIHPKTRKCVGIWINHRKALVASLTNDRPHVVRVDSDFEGYFRPQGGSRVSTPYGHKSINDEKKTQGRRRQQLKSFYRNVIKEIGDADEILIMGGGKAKTELERMIQKIKSLSHRIVGVIPVCEMTENEIIADMKKFFKIPVKRNT